MKKYSFTPLLSTLVLSLGFASCASNPPESAYQARLTSKAPASTKTVFDDAVQCMDNMFLDFGIRDIRITTTGIPDRTKEISAGTRSMLISAVNRMSSKSRAFTYIDYEEVSQGFGIAPDRRIYPRQTDLLTPEYYIRGEISGFDESVLNKSKGIGLRFDGKGGGVNSDETTSVVSVDMYVGELATGIVVPHVYAQNSIAVSRKSKALDATFDLELESELLGSFAQAASSQSEGMHTAIRTLIELNAIEALGKLARVPYWRCLGVTNLDDRARKQASKLYSSLTDAERVSFVWRALSELGYADINTPLGQSSDLKQSIWAYQSDQNQFMDGVVSEALFVSLILRVEKLAPSDSGPTIPEDSLYISIFDALDFPTFMVGMPLDVKIRLNKSGYLSCYYKDGLGNISQIYPNRFQPNYLIEAGVELAIPGNDKRFQIVFDQPEVIEEVMCAGSVENFAEHLPIGFPTQDLEPLDFDSLDDVESALLNIDAVQMRSNRVQFLVRPKKTKG